jgi:hypothetical protein
MKKLMYTLCVVVLLSTACKKNETETTDTSNTTTNTDTTTTPTEDAHAISVDVEYVGLVCQVWDKSQAGVERAIVLRTPRGGPRQHNMNIGLPRVSKADVDKLGLPINPIGECPAGSTCNVLMDGLAFRFVDSAGNPLASAFEPNDNFKNFVTHLSTVPHKDKPFEKKSSLVDAVFSPTPKANDPVVAGWFELTGGKGDAEPFACKGKFKNDANDQDFVKVAKVTFTLPEGAKLQVFKAGDTQWRNITIPTSRFAITVDNDATDPMNVSHFHEYARLNRSSVVLPEVEIADTQDCLGDTTTTIGIDGVPGCSNSAWP